MSNLIKSSYYIPLNDRKLIEVLQSRMEESGQTLPGLPVIEPDVNQRLEEIESERLKILAEAEQAADELRSRASEEAGQLKEQARREIEAWWNERREQDKQSAEESRRSGFQQGYQEGLQLAEQEIHGQYEQMIVQAKGLLEEAYDAKRQIIHEAEPFLVSLSAAIAEKLLDRELRNDKGWTTRLIQKLLARRKWKGPVTICVSPEAYSQIFHSRDELALAAGSGAEIQVVPDPAVTGGGCMIRTEYGTLDARIDMQLQDIKTSLLKLAGNHGGAQA